jgi:hypothetical protein
MGRERFAGRRVELVSAAHGILVIAVSASYQFPGKPHILLHAHNS